jgi:hypothetical protein
MGAGHRILKAGEASSPGVLIKDMPVLSPPRMIPQPTRTGIKSIFWFAFGLNEENRSQSGISPIRSLWEILSKITKNSAGATPDRWASDIFII